MKKKFLMMVLAVVLLFGDTVQTVFAESSKAYNRDTSDIVYDLEGLEIDGKKFNSENFGYDKDGETQLLYFAEVGFSELSSENYALYVYMYNPSAINYEQENSGNIVQIATSFNSEGFPCPSEQDQTGLISCYTKFSLKFCNQSSDKLYIKYRVLDNDNILYEAVKNYFSIYDKRCYYVSGVELSNEDIADVVEYGVGKIFTYYTKEEVLKCDISFFDVLKLNVIPCYYLASDSSGFANALSFVNGKNSVGSAVQINSVYFELDKSILEKYGDLQGISAQWVKGVLSPIYITNHKSFYDTFMDNKYLFKDLTNIKDLKFKYGFGIQGSSYTNVFWEGNLFGDGGDKWIFQKRVDYRYGFNLPSFWKKKGWGSSNDIPLRIPESGKINNINFLFYADVDSLSNYSLSPEELENFIKNSVQKAEDMGLKGYNTQQCGSSFTALAQLFQSVEKTSVSFSYGDSVFEEAYGDTVGFVKNYYSLMFSGLSDKSTVIYKIKQSDINSASVANDLWLSQNSYNEIKDNLTSALSDGSDKVPYLFRFDCSDYKANLGRLFENGWSKGLKVGRVEKSVYFDFDIIELSFYKDNGTLSSVPVVCSPQDFYFYTDLPDSKEGGGCKGFNFDSFFDILKIIGIVLVLILLFPVLPYIIKFVVWIVALPFKLISKTVKLFKKKKNKNKKE